MPPGAQAFITRAVRGCFQGVLGPLQLPIAIKLQAGPAGPGRPNRDLPGRHRRQQPSGSGLGGPDRAGAGRPYGRVQSLPNSLCGGRAC